MEKKNTQISSQKQLLSTIAAKMKSEPTKKNSESKASGSVVTATTFVYPGSPPALSDVTSPGRYTILITGSQTSASFSAELGKVEVRARRANLANLNLEWAESPSPIISITDSIPSGTYHVLVVRDA